LRAENQRLREQLEQSLQKSSRAILDQRERVVEAQKGMQVAWSRFEQKERLSEPVKAEDIDSITAATTIPPVDKPDAIRHNDTVLLGVTYTPSRKSTHILPLKRDPLFYPAPPHDRTFTSSHLPTTPPPLPHDPEQAITYKPPYDPDCCSGLFDCNALSGIATSELEPTRTELDILVDVAVHEKRQDRRLY
jgi:hypothetical protein